MSKIIPYNEFINEGYKENIKILLSSLKDASEEELAKVSDILSRKLTWATSMILQK
jgi:hypothetical protein